MTQLVYLPAADADLLDIYLVIAADDPVAADRFIDRIRRAILRLRDYPLSAPARSEFGENIRCLTVGVYRVLDRVVGSQVFIVRVIHAARDPDALLD